MIDMDKAQRLVKDLRSCCGDDGCAGCSREMSIQCGKSLGKDAADMLEALVEFLQQPKVVSVAIYDQEEIHHNCSVQILTNSVTGDVSVGWWPNEEGGAE